MNNFTDPKMTEIEEQRSNSRFQLLELLSELAWSASNVLRDFGSASRDGGVFTLVSFLFIKEGVLSENGYRPDPSNNNCFYLDEIYKLFSSTLVKVFERKDPRVLDCLDRLRSWNLEEMADVAWWFFKDSFAIDKFSGEYYQPEDLTEFMLGLAGYKEGNVYNPFAGVASFGEKLNIGEKYVAEEINQTTYGLGLINLLLHNCSPKNYSLANSLINSSNSRFDYYLASPPFGMMVEGSFLNAIAKEGYPSSKIDINEFALLSSIEKTKADGKSVILCAPRILSSAKGRSTRRLLVERNLLDTVVLLPFGIFKTTGSSSVVIVLRKDRLAGEPIRLVDATDGYVRNDRTLSTPLLLSDIEENKPCVQYVKAERILEDECSWNPIHYKELQVDDPRYKVVRLGDILQQAPVCFVPTPTTEYNEVLTANLVNDPYRYDCSPTLVDPNQNSDTMARRGFSSNRRNGRKVVFNTPTLVVASLGKLKYGYFRATESAPIHVSDGYFTFDVNTKVIRPDYLAIMLNQYAQPYYKGSSIPHLNIKDFLHIQIPVPSLELQAEVVKKMYAEHNVSLGREIELEQKIKEIESAFSQRNGMNQHNLATPAAQVKATCITLKQQLKDCNLTPETRLLVDTLVERQLLQIHNLLASVYTLDQGLGFGNPEEFNFDEYLSKYNKTSISDRFKVTYFLDQMGLDDAGIEPIVLANEPSFVQMVSNIIRNADKHGFTDASRADYYIDIDVRLDPSGKFFVFSFSNNGTPISIDTAHYKMKGETAGKNKGKGLGGYYVYEMARNFGGDIEVSSRQNPDLTTIKVKLPVIDEEL